jgi:hypothetical protein
MLFVEFILQTNSVGHRQLVNDGLTFLVDIRLNGFQIENPEMVPVVREMYGGIAQVPTKDNLVCE